MTVTFRQELDKIDRQLEYLLQRLEGYSGAILDQVPAPGKWSVLMVLHHLKLGEELTQQYLKKKLSFNPKLKKANFITTLRGFALRHYFKLPMKIKAPKIVAEENFPTGMSLAEIREEWLASRQSMRVFLENLDEELYKRELYKHPIGGKMRLKDMLVFFEVHMRHHEKQIDRVLKEVAAS